MFFIPGPACGDALGTILKVGARFAAPPDGFGRMHDSMRIVYTTICIMYHQFSFNSLGRTGLILLLLRPKAKLKCVQMPTSDHDMSVTANGAAASATAVCVCHVLVIFASSIVVFRFTAASLFTWTLLHRLASA